MDVNWKCLPRLLIAICISGVLFTIIPDEIVGPVGSVLGVLAYWAIIGGLSFLAAVWLLSRFHTWWINR